MASSERVTIPKGWKLTKASMTTSKDGNGERTVRLYFKDSKKNRKIDIETPFPFTNKRKGAEEHDDINKYRDFILLCYKQGWNFEWPMAAPTVKLCHEHFPGLRDAETPVAVLPAYYTEASMQKFLSFLESKHSELRHSVTPSTWRDACARVQLPEKYSLDDFHFHMENLLSGEKQIFNSLADLIAHENLVDKNSPFYKELKGRKDYFEKAIETLKPACDLLHEHLEGRTAWKLLFPQDDRDMIEQIETPTFSPKQSERIPKQVSLCYFILKYAIEETTDLLTLVELGLHHYEEDIIDRGGTPQKKKSKLDAGNIVKEVRSVNALYDKYIKQARTLMTADRDRDLFYQWKWVPAASTVKTWLLSFVKHKNFLPDGRGLAKGPSLIYEEDVQTAIRAELKNSQSVSVDRATTMINKVVRAFLDQETQDLEGEEKKEKEEKML